MEVFTNISRCKTNLVTVWRITVCRCFRNHLLWQFTSTSFSNWCCNITSTWDTHGLVNIWTTWQWVTNGPTDTSSSPTKWFDLRWVVVRFILEHKKPWFFDTIDIYFNFNWAGIDFIRHFHVIQTTISTLIATKNSRHIHQGLRFFCTSQLITHGNIFVISRLQLFFKFRCWEVDILQLSLKSCVTAVVRPVSIQNLKLSLSWHTSNRLEVILNEEKVIHFHGQSLLCLILSKIFCRISFKEIQAWNGLVRLREILFSNTNSDIFETRIHWVQKVVFDSFQLIRIDILVNQVQLRCVHCYVIWTTKQKQSFLWRCCTLVKLTRQTFDSKESILLKISLNRSLVQNSISHLLREDVFFRTRKQVLCQIKDIVNLNNTKIIQSFQLKIML